MNGDAVSFKVRFCTFNITNINNDQTQLKIYTKFIFLEIAVKSLYPFIVFL